MDTYSLQRLILATDLMPTEKLVVGEHNTFWARPTGRKVGISRQPAQNEKQRAD